MSLVLKELVVCEEEDCPDEPEEPGVRMVIEDWGLELNEEPEEPVKDEEEDPLEKEDPAFELELNDEPEEVPEDPENEDDPCCFCGLGLISTNPSLTSLVSEYPMAPAV